jgi:hypothetical protein
MRPNCISFLKGVDRHGADPPVGFPHRFAVLTWFSRGPDSADPWPLLRRAVPRIMDLVGANVVQAEVWEQCTRLGVFSKANKVREAPLSEWLIKGDDDLHEQAVFPSKLRFEQKGEVVLWMESEMWSLVGGPLPYHDSVTLSFFSKTDLGNKLEELFRMEAAKAGVKIEEAA